MNKQQAKTPFLKLPKSVIITEYFKSTSSPLSSPDASDCEAHSFTAEDNNVMEIVAEHFKFPLGSTVNL